MGPKQRLFVEEYLACWNASEAARRAKYRHPGQAGHRMLKNVEVLAEIERRLSEKAMLANEVLARLADIARADMRMFVRVDKAGNPVGFDLGADKALNLVRKVSVTDKGVSVELLDPLAALVKLGEYHKLFVQKHEVIGKDGQPLPNGMIGVVAVDYRSGLAEVAPRPIPDSDAPSQDKGSGDGPAVGQDGVGRRAGDEHVAPAR